MALSNKTCGAIVGGFAFLAFLGVVAAVPSSEALASKPATTVTTWPTLITLPPADDCREDDPCWDCEVHGNRVCGKPEPTTTSSTQAPTTSTSTSTTAKPEPTTTTTDPRISDMAASTVWSWWMADLQEVLNDGRFAVAVNNVVLLQNACKQGQKLIGEAPVGIYSNVDLNNYMAMAVEAARIMFKGCASGNMVAFETGADAYMGALALAAVELEKI